MKASLRTKADGYSCLWRAWVEGVNSEYPESGTVGPQSVGPAPSPVEKRVVPEKEMTAGGGGPTPEAVPHRRRQKEPPLLWHGFLTMPPLRPKVSI